MMPPLFYLINLLLLGFCLTIHQPFSFHFAKRFNQSFAICHLSAIEAEIKFRTVAMQMLL